MTDVWNRLGSLLEARPRSKGPVGDLLGHISDRYGEHAADELSGFIQGHPFPEVQRYVAYHFMGDDRAAKLTGALSSLMGGGGPGPSKGAAPQPAPGGRSHDKGSRPAEPPERPERSATAGSQLATPSAPSGHAVGGPGLRQKPQDYSMSPGVGPGSSRGIEPSHTGVQKPTKPGDFIGQHWQPSAYSAPQKDKEADEVGEIETAIERELAKPRPDLDTVNHLKAKLGIMQRRAGGFKKRSIQHGAQATGQMARGAVSQNPARPGSVVRRQGGETVRWTDEHPGWYWAGPEHGWVSKSEFVSLVGSGKVKSARRA